MDFIITNAREGRLTDQERRDALRAAREALAADATQQEAELAGARAAFAHWEVWPESYALIDVITIGETS
jgi:hypothetical protein